eukprot:1119210-Pelagomonas_calceolata.AAC.2
MKLLWSRHEGISIVLFQFGFSWRLPGGSVALVSVALHFSWEIKKHKPNIFFKGSLCICSQFSMIASCGKALAATARAGMRLSSAGGVPSSNTHQFLQAATSQSSSQQQQQQQHNHTQQASDASDEVPQQPPGVHVVPFPQLSPPMHTGRLTKWLKQPGDRVELVSVRMVLDPPDPFGQTI